MCNFYNQMQTITNTHGTHRNKSREKFIESNYSIDFLTYNKLSYFSLLTPCRIDERRLSEAASSSTILNIQFELKTFI
jgi:hypothetical protein